MPEKSELSLYAEQSYSFGGMEKAPFI